MYLLSLHGARPIMWFYKKFFAKHFSHGQLDWMSTHIGKIVFFSRFLVQLRFIGPFMAGQKKMSFWSFVMYDGLAVLIYAPLYLFLGLFFHSRIQSITHNIGVVQNIILIMVGLAIAFGFFKYMYRKFFEKKDLLTSDQTEITK
jgi:membrane protein DedA with SNARE-associated domain